MVAAEGHGHEVAVDDLAVDARQYLANRADTEDRGLRWVDDGRIAVIPYMPRFETVNVAPESSPGVTSPLRTRSASRRDFGGDRPKGLLVGVEDGGHDERVLGGDGDADVDARVELEAAIPV